MKDLKNANIDETEILYTENKTIEERKLNDWENNLSRICK